MPYFLVCAHADNIRIISCTFMVHYPFEYTICQEHDDLDGTFPTLLQRLVAGSRWHIRFREELVGDGRDHAKSRTCDYCREAARRITTRRVRVATRSELRRRIRRRETRCMRRCNTRKTRQHEEMHDAAMQDVLHVIPAGDQRWMNMTYCSLGRQ
jgi:hypothetical protein